MCGVGMDDRGWCGTRRRAAAARGEDVDRGPDFAGLGAAPEGLLLDDGHPGDEDEDGALGQGVDHRLR